MGLSLRENVVVQDDMTRKVALSKGARSLSISIKRQGGYRMAETV